MYTYYEKGSVESKIPLSHLSHVQIPKHTTLRKGKLEI